MFWLSIIGMCEIAPDDISATVLFIFAEFLFAIIIPLNPADSADRINAPKFLGSCTLSIINKLDAINVDTATKFVASCKNFDGGFGCGTIKGNK